MWVRGSGSTTLCNWFSKPESPEVAVHMESNCDLRLYWHSHNPLPILQQAPWQTGGTEADNPLSKQVHVAVIAHCSPSLALIGFAHRSAGEMSQSSGFFAARATLLISNKMILQTQVASICFTKRMPVNTVQWVRASGPLVLLQARSHLLRH